MRIGHMDATVTFRGNEVVDFDPPGEVGPLWMNKRVGQGTPEVGRTYFIPDDVVHW